MFAEENIEETHALPQSLFGNGKLFMLRAFGDTNQRKSKKVYS